MKEKLTHQKAIDHQIAQIFKAETENVTCSDLLKRRIDQTILQDSIREEQGMRKFSLRKKCVLGVACVLAVSSICYAASQVTQYTTTSSMMKEETNYGKLSELEMKLGYKVDVPESFTNGYKFKSMEVVETKAQDDSKATVNTFKELLVTYEKADSKKLTLSIQQNPNKDSEEKVEPKATQTVDDVVFNYYMDTYKFVPTDYKLTAEEEANMKKEDYMISYGSDKVEVNKISHVNWEVGQTQYTIMGSNVALNSDELIKMATETLK